jgi:hypothetical protein
MVNGRLKPVHAMALEARSQVINSFHSAPLQRSPAVDLPSVCDIQRRYQQAQSSSCQRRTAHRTRFSSWHAMPLRASSKV